jgi:signal transduction histidine kinase
MSYLYLAGIMLVAFYGGLGPAILAGLISSIAIDYFYVEPVGRILDNWQSFAVWVAVLGISGGLSFLASSLKAAYERAREAQQKAEEAVRAREHTLAVVSHDLRQPLSAAALELQLLLRDGPSRHAEKALSLITRIEKLIRDLLEASKADSYALRLEPRDPVLLCRTASRISSAKRSTEGSISSSSLPRSSSP